MAKQKLSELPLVTSINQADLLYIVQSSISKATNVKTLVASIYTGNIKESFGNLYFTNSRSRRSLTVTGGASFDYDTGVLDVTNFGAVEGNLYLTNTYVYGNILPTENVTFNLGNATLRWKDLFLSGTTIDLGGAKVTTDAATGTMAFVAAPSATNPNPNALVITPSGKTVTVTTTAGTLDTNVISNTLITNPGFSGSFLDLTNKPNTTIIPEGANLYYSNDRVWSNVYPTLNLKANVVDLTTANVLEVNNLYFTNSRVYSNISPLLTTANVLEVNNLYFTNTRARESISVTGSGSYDSNTGIITVTGGVINVNGQTGNITLTTTNLAEGSNLYYSNDRVYANIFPLLTTANVVEVNNQYFSNAKAILAATPAVTQLVVTTPVFNYNLDQYNGDNPTIYVKAGDTISFALNQSASHPFAIRVSNGGSNYNTGLTHVDNNGTISTGASAQGKVTGKLFWKIPYELAGNTYVYQCTNHSSMVGSIVIENSISKSLVNITANSITANTFISTGSGIPTLESSTNINLAANAAVVITQSVLRLASFTDGQVANLSAVAGDIVYNSTNNKFQGYATGGWKDLH